jgi:SPP1 family predicted phage head-tail adaptor
MPINPGRLDRRITLEAPTVTRDSVGGVVNSYATVATVWAELLQDQSRGREIDEGGARRALGSIRLRIRGRSDLAETWRVGMAGKLYDITALLPQGTRGEFVIIEAETTAGVTP